VKEVIQLLVNRLNLIPEIKEVRIFNNQLEHLEEEYQFIFPAALIEPFDISYLTLSTELQEVTCGVRIHIIADSPLQGQEMTIYELGEAVNQWLYQYTGNGNLSPLVRTTAELDFNHSNVYVYKIEYTTRFVDKTIPLEQSEITLTDFITNIQLDIDSPVIRSGDNIL
jgi:hypothetical protein